MSYGIKVFNSSGRTVFDSTHSLGGKAVIIPYFSQFYEVST